MRAGRSTEIEISHRSTPSGRGTKEESRMAAKNRPCPPSGRRVLDAHEANLDKAISMTLLFGSLAYENSFCSYPDSPGAKRRWVKPREEDATRLSSNSSQAEAAGPSSALHYSRWASLLRKDPLTSTTDTFKMHIFLKRAPVLLKTLD